MSYSYTTTSVLWTRHKHLLLLVLVFTFFFSCKRKVENKPIEAKSAEYSETDFQPIFNGSSLENWHGDERYWSVENGLLKGEVTADKPLKTNTFLIYDKGELSDFELKLEFKIEASGNSGINYRSELVDSIPFALKGYQADIDGKNRYTGQNYEERKRTTLAYRGEHAQILSQEGAGEHDLNLRDNVKNNAWQSRQIVEILGKRDSLGNLIEKEEWNSCRLLIKGNRLQHFVNGVLMSEVEDLDKANRRSSGLLGLQLHVGPPMKVYFRNIYLKTF